jgi:nitroreductase
MEERIVMTEAKFEPLSSYVQYSADEMRQRAISFYKEMQRRRTVRYFSDRPVPRGVIEACLLTAGTAPSGANLQPWHFVVVSDPKVKHEIRQSAEEEEAEFYHRRAPKEWLEALAPLGTDEHKPFLDTAPYLIAIFGKNHSELPDGRRVKNYYVHESIGIATGFLIAALHNAGLVSLTHTPSPMGFLNTILDRPADEKPFVLLVTGFPADDAKVPVIQKKSLEEIATFV